MSLLVVLLILLLLFGGGGATYGRWGGGGPAWGSHILWMLFVIVLILTVLHWFGAALPRY